MDWSAELARLRAVPPREFEAKPWRRLLDALAKAPSVLRHRHYLATHFGYAMCDARAAAYHKDHEFAVEVLERYLRIAELFEQLEQLEWQRKPGPFGALALVRPTPSAIEQLRRLLDAQRLLAATRAQLRAAAVGDLAIAPLLGYHVLGSRITGHTGIEAGPPQLLEIVDELLVLREQTTVV